MVHPWILFYSMDPRLINNDLGGRLPPGMSCPKVTDKFKRFLSCGMIPVRGYIGASLKAICIQNPSIKISLLTIIPAVVPMATALATVRIGVVLSPQAKTP